MPSTTPKRWGGSRSQKTFDALCTERLYWLAEIERLRERHELELQEKDQIIARLRRERDGALEQLSRRGKGRSGDGDRGKGPTAIEVVRAYSAERRRQPSEKATEIALQERFGWDPRMVRCRRLRFDEEQLAPAMGVSLDWLRQVRRRASRTTDT